MRKGLFIVLEGNDGSGKATQTELLLQRFRDSGQSAEKVDFPNYGRSVFGDLLGECLAGKRGDFVNLDPKIASSLYALDRFESSKLIREKLESGISVIADRYAGSNQIHQGGKIANLDERKAFLKWLEKVEFEILGIPRPDIILYLRVPLENSLALLHEKREAKNSILGANDRDVVEEDRLYLERSAAAADWLAERESGWHVIDCVDNGTMLSREQIHELLWEPIRSLA